MEAWGDSSYGGSGVPEDLNGVANVYGTTFYLGQSLYPHTYHFEDNWVPVPTSQPTSQTLDKTHRRSHHQRLRKLYRLQSLASLD